MEDRGDHWYSPELDVSLAKSRWPTMADAQAAVDYFNATKDRPTPDKVMAWQQQAPEAVQQPQAGAPGQAMPEERTALQEGLRQAGLTVRSGVEGLAGAAGVFADPIAAILNAFMPEDQKFPTTQSLFSNILNMAGVPEPETKAEMAVDRINQVVAGAGGMAGAARGITRAATPAIAEATEALAAGPGRQIMGAAGSQAAIEAVQEPGVQEQLPEWAQGAPSELAAGLAGGMVGARPRLQTARRAVDPAIAEAEARGIDVMTSDVMPPKTWAGRQAREAIPEKMPMIGTGGRRAAQVEQRLEAIRNTAADYGALSVDDYSELAPEIVDDFFRTRQARLTKLTGAKQDIIDRHARRGVVNVKNAIAKIDQEIADLERISPTQNKEIINYLNQFKEDIQGKDLLDIEELRKALGDQLGSDTLANVKSAADKVKRGIYGALNEDIGQFIKGQYSEQDFRQWQSLNKQMSSMMDELDKGVLKSVLQRGEETPELVHSLIFSKKPSDVKAIYRDLSSAGKSKVRTAIMAKAVQDAGGIDNLSAERFQTAVRKLAVPMGIFYKGQNLENLKGLGRALELTKQATRAGLSPPTGQQAIPWIAAGGVGAGAMANLPATAATVGGVLSYAGLIRLSETKAVRDILLKLPKVAKGSPEEAALLKRLTAIILKAQQEE